LRTKLTNYAERGRNPAIRFAEHYGSGTARAGLRYQTIEDATFINKIDARIFEQKMINSNGYINGGQLINLRNSIVPKY